MIRWETPPDNHRGPRSRVLKDLAELRAHPGRWALVAIYKRIESATNSVAGAKRRAPLAVRGIEFTCRRMPDGRGAVYARAVADETDGARFAVAGGEALPRRQPGHIPRRGNPLGDV